jgi:hypothetical protein
MEGKLIEVDINAAEYKAFPGETCSYPHCRQPATVVLERSWWVRNRSGAHPAPTQFDSVRREACEGHRDSFRMEVFGELLHLVKKESY